MSFRFGRYELSPETRLLTSDAEPIPLTRKAFQLLELLLRRRPLVVSKADVQDVLWPDTYVVEANIANLVAEIRTAIGDSARKPRFVRTAPGTGYAFHGPATECAAPGASHAFVGTLTADGQTLVLQEGEYVIGRSTTCELMLRSSTVSRRHAKVIVAGETVTIEDLKSRNGTFVAGRRLSAPVHVSDGDPICIGTVWLTFHRFESSATTRPIPRAARPSRTSERRDPRRS